jgi:hypothetical protein
MRTNRLCGSSLIIFYQQTTEKKIFCQEKQLPSASVQTPFYKNKFLTSRLHTCKKKMISSPLFFSLSDLILNP